MVHWIVVIGLSAVLLAMLAYPFLEIQRTTQDIKRSRIKHKAYLWQLRKAKRFKKRGSACVFIVR